jgi:hypothetical protein
VTSTVEPPLRTCRTCGKVERNIHYRCTNCGRDYAADPPRFSKRQKVTAAVVAGVVVAVGLAIAIPLLLSGKSKDEAKQSAAGRAAAARQAARLRMAQRPVPGRLAVPVDPGSTSARQTQVAALEAAITRDARARVASGRLKGPVHETLCGPLESGVRRGDELDLGKRIGRFDCVAVLRDVIKQGKVVGHLGHNYVGVIDFATGAYVVCQANPNQSEAGRDLALAPLPPACLNAHGPRLKGGFIADRRDAREPLPLLARAART